MDRLEARIDHVAVAVDDLDAAVEVWGTTLGGGLRGNGDNGDFRIRQLRYANDAKLELLAPPEDAADGNFARAFLDRFGSQVHHVTLTVPDLAEAVSVLEAAGLHPVDVRFGEYWHEAFLRPSEVGGLVVQVAWSGASEETWAARTGRTLHDPAPDAMRLLGPLLHHPDLDHVRTFWALLGATLDEDAGTIVCSWPDSPLTVAVREGAPAGPVGLRVEGAIAIDPFDRIGVSLLTGES